MSDSQEFIFKISAYTPATIPMGRLAEYMRELANLLGEQPSVHFERLDEGSTAVVHKIEFEAQPKIADRLARVKAGNAPEDARKAERTINDMLKKDNASGSYSERKGAEIIEFPGVRISAPEKYGPINQHGTLDGVVVKLGGKQDVVPIMLRTRDGYENHCFATKEIARELSPLYERDEIRCTGMGRWCRNEDGVWELEEFLISGFEILDQRSLPEIVADLRTVEGSAWKELKDPWTELTEIQAEDGEGA